MAATKVECLKFTEALTNVSVTVGHNPLMDLLHKCDKDQLSLRNPRDALHHARVMRCITANMLQTKKVDAQCDKLATGLS